MILLSFDSDLRRVPSANPQHHTGVTPLFCERKAATLQAAWECGMRGRATQEHRHEPDRETTPHHDQAPSARAFLWAAPAERPAWPNGCRPHRCMQRSSGPRKNADATPTNRRPPPGPNCRSQPSKGIRSGHPGTRSSFCSATRLISSVRLPPRAGARLVGRGLVVECFGRKLGVARGNLVDARAQRRVVVGARAGRVRLLGAHGGDPKPSGGHLCEARPAVKSARWGRRQALGRLLIGTWQALSRFEASLAQALRGLLESSWQALRRLFETSWQYFGVFAGSPRESHF